MIKNVKFDYIQENINFKHKSGFVAFLQTHLNEFMISMTLHSILLFLLVLISPSADTVNIDVVEIPIVEEEKPQEPPPKKEEPKMEVTENRNIETITDETTANDNETVDVPIPQPTDQPETETAGECEQTDMKAIMAGTTGEVSDIPEGIQGPGGISYGREDGGGLPHGYKSRSKKGKIGALKTKGGSGTEPIVEAALNWLAYHQEADGSWDATKYEGSHGDKVPITSIALLSFFGSGYSENIGPFRKTIRLGVQWLNAKCMEGKNNLPTGNMYSLGIALQTLSEATIFGTKQQTTMNAESIAKSFLDCYNGNGWRYSLNAMDDDMSVSGWVALGLKSAKAAELSIMKGEKADKTIKGYKDWVLTMTLENLGQGGYAAPGAAGPNMTYVGMFARQFLNFPKNDPYLTKASENVLRWTDANITMKEDKIIDVYGLYYGTLASFQQQGAIWKSWNNKMKTVLLGTQRKGDPKELGGSWDPDDKHVGKQGGRVMMTALCSLCLEVYYRYEMMN